ncbi:MAG: hydantoinase B/oxoprolinase family protein [Thermodesulfobacteriota bacterium]
MSPARHQGKIEPFLFAILARKFDSITKEMTNTLLRSGRSGVVNMGHDFSCATVDNQHRVISVADGSPCHIGAAGLQTSILEDIFGNDIHPGDCFINTCSYFGNTHNGDFTIFAPVFYQGERLFYTLTRAHQADIGAPIPSSYLAFSKTIYEEGLQLPCMRIQRDYKDIEEMIRMCRIRIRVPEQWYGDYLAQIGAVRIAERRCLELCQKYGLETIKAFFEEWQEYGQRCMIEEIRKMPRVVLEGLGGHDPVPGVADNGIPIKVKIAVEPEEGRIVVDLRDNMDNVPGGFNLSEATTRSATLIGVLHTMPASVPHNEGAFSRIEILMREGAVVGKPKYPVSTGLATSNVADRLATIITSTFAQLGPPYGSAEGNTSFVAAPVISGKDWRYNDAEYINQLIILGGGPGVCGYDGWVIYGVAQDNGVLHQDSVEVTEQKYPLLFDKEELTTDTGGDGQWRGAPTLDVQMGPRKAKSTFHWFNDQHFNPARGVLGGAGARPSNALKLDLDTGQTTQLDQFGSVDLNPNERFIALNATGGGYGDPLERDPEAVRWDVREEIVSFERARDVYGVVIDTGPEKYTVDYEATKKLRQELKNKRGKE